MTPKLDPVRLTVVDIMGVFLPGAVWTILLLTLRDLTSGAAAETPFSLAFSIAIGDSYGARPVQLGASFYAAFVVVSLLLGYVMMALSSKVAEQISRPWSTLTGTRDSLFPYVAKYAAKPYFAELQRFLRKRLQVDDLQSLPGYQPFETCKRLLKMHAPALWEDAQRREAQVRMLASLLLACVFSAVLAAYATWLRVPSSASWLGWSVGIALLVVYAFRVRRSREVADVYISALILAGIEGQSATDHDGLV